MKKEYKDYGEYLEDAYEESLAECEKMAARSAQYGQPSNKLTITEKNGELEAEWIRIEKDS